MLRWAAGRCLAQVKRAGYAKFDAVFIPGGHIPMQDLLKDKGLGELLTDFHNKNKAHAGLFITANDIVYAP